MKIKKGYIEILLFILGIFLGLGYLYSGNYTRAILFFVIGCSWLYIYKNDKKVKG